MLEVVRLPRACRILNWQTNILLFQVLAVWLDNQYFSTWSVDTFRIAVRIVEFSKQRLHARIVWYDGYRLSLPETTYWPGLRFFIGTWKYCRWFLSSHKRRRWSFQHNFVVRSASNNMAVFSKCSKPQGKRKRTKKAKLNRNRKYDKTNQSRSYQEPRSKEFPCMAEVWKRQVQNVL